MSPETSTQSKWYINDEAVADAVRSESAAFMVAYWDARNELMSTPRPDGHRAVETADGRTMYTYPVKGFEHEMVYAIAEQLHKIDIVGLSIFKRLAGG